MSVVGLGSSGKRPMYPCACSVNHRTIHVRNVRTSDPFTIAHMLIPCAFAHAVHYVLTIRYLWAACPSARTDRFSG